MAYAEDGGCAMAVAPPPPSYSAPVPARDTDVDRRRECFVGVGGCCLTVLIMVVIAFLGSIAGGVVYHKIHQSNVKKASNTPSPSATVSDAPPTTFSATSVQISTISAAATTTVTTTAVVTTATTTQAIESSWQGNPAGMPYQSFHGPEWPSGSGWPGGPGGRAAHEQGPRRSMGR